MIHIAPSTKGLWCSHNFNNMKIIVVRTHVLDAGRQDQRQSLSSWLDKPGSHDVSRDSDTEACKEAVEERGRPPDQGGTGKACHCIWT